MEQKLKDGRLQIAQSKKDKEEVTVIGGGGGKKKGRNRNKDQAKVEEQKQQDGQIAIDLPIISKFNVVMMSPPTSLDQLDAKIDELKTKQA